MTPVIEVDRLEKSFGHKKALRGVNLKVFEGEFIVLFGPNGAGKTTLLKSISTLIRPTRGRILFKGKEIDDGSISLRETIGLVSHNTLLYEDLTAFENLLFYARMYGVPNPKQKIEELLHMVGLYHRKDDVVRTFSRGMLQRLTIARAILHDPPVLLLDEPYTGLDVQAMKILDDLLYNLKDGLRTFIMTSHDIQKGFEHATRLAILHSGEIVFDKKKEEISVLEFEEEFWKWVKEKEPVF
ncbi:MAG: ABC transporter ATP-binding protein [Actinobacteria bacterium]|nr:ABC transporter ATP-binding protein [Actinomycetota bacterium]